MTSDHKGNGRDGETGRFRKGASGNPHGRPRKPTTVAAAIRSALSEKVQITQNGRRKRVTKLDANAMQVATRGASGDHRYSKLVFDLAQKAEEKQATGQQTEAELSASDSEIVDRVLTRLRRIWQEEG
jgi:hypothetical protein